ncbi:MAG: tetratricopeptide repeat protein, partial [Bryobacterales bacterium]|nr:tetratricopeptide repeat protein [Bryobacterales bacterium]
MLGLGCIRIMPVIMALLALPSIGQKPEFDWNAVHGRVNDLLQLGRTAEAQLVLEESVKAARARGERSAGLASALNDLGTLYHDSGRFADADRAYGESLSLWRRIPEAVRETAVALDNLAGLRMAQGKPSDAEKLYIDAQQLVISTYGAKSPEAANTLTGLADVYLEMGKYDKATQLGERAVGILETTGQGPPQLGVALFIVAKAAWMQNRTDEAERFLRRALETWLRSRGPQDLTYLTGLVCLATLVSKRNPSEGGRLFSEALGSLETQLGPNHYVVGSTLVLYAQNL